MDHSYSVEKLFYIVVVGYLGKKITKFLLKLQKELVRFSSISLDIKHSNTRILIGNFIWIVSELTEGNVGVATEDGAKELVLRCFQTAVYMDFVLLLLASCCLVVGWKALILKMNMAVLLDICPEFYLSPVSACEKGVLCSLSCFKSGKRLFLTDLSSKSKPVYLLK